MTTACPEAGKHEVCEKKKSVNPVILHITSTTIRDSNNNNKRNKHCLLLRLLLLLLLLLLLSRRHSSAIELVLFCKYTKPIMYVCTWPLKYLQPMASLFPSTKPHKKIVHPAGAIA